MATIDVLTLNLSANTKTAMRVARLLMPFVFLRLLSAERAASLVMRFVKVNIVASR